MVVAKEVETPLDLLPHKSAQCTIIIESLIVYS